MLVFNTAFNQINPVPFLYSFHTEGIMNGTCSAFFLVLKVLCSHFGLDLGLIFDVLTKHYYQKQLKGGKGFMSAYISTFPSIPSSSPYLGEFRAGTEAETMQEHWLPSYSLAPSQA